MFGPIGAPVSPSRSCCSVDFVRINLLWKRYAGSLVEVVRLRPMHEGLFAMTCTGYDQII